MNTREIAVDLPFVVTNLLADDWQNQLESGIQFTLNNQSVFCIRRMVKGDLKRVVQLEQEIFLDPWPVSAFSFDLKNHNGNLSLIGMKGNIVIAYAICHCVIDELHINNFAVAAEFRREGCGAALMWTILKIAAFKNIAELRLEVRQSNTAAIALYEKFGFQTVGVRKKYYAQENEDALLMTLFRE